MENKVRLKLIYLGGFLIAVHYASIAYVNSTLLSQFVGNSALNILYILGSIFSILFLFVGPKLLRKFGSVTTFMFFILLEIVAVFGMGNANMALFVIILFLVHTGAESMLHFSLDLNLEQETKLENTTGSKRGIFLFIQNIAWVLSPLLMAALFKSGGFQNVYLLSGIALCPLLILTALFFKDTRKPKFEASHVPEILKSLFKNKDQARIIGIQFVLNFFYSWMVIYLPLLLNKEMGFGWDKIGIIFTVMLLPFILFELPAGILGDKKIGEKELLISGFIIMFISTLFIPMLKTDSLIVWSIILFATRVGASLIEISSESYFFKHVKEQDVGLISLFRMARPFSFILAPLLAIPIIHFFPYSTSFYFLAFFTLSGLLFIPKVDTK